MIIVEPIKKKVNVNMNSKNGKWKEKKRRFRLTKVFPSFSWNGLIHSINAYFGGRKTFVDEVEQCLNETKG